MGILVGGRGVKKKSNNSYLIRTNFRAVGMRENQKFVRGFLIAHLQIFKFQKPEIWQQKRKTGTFLCAKLAKFATNFRAILCKSRFCTEMRDNLYARKFRRRVKVHRAGYWCINLVRGLQGVGSSQCRQCGFITFVCTQIYS